nr:berberine bridge enzyme-like 21 [Tanacetum cinerariifolium]
MKSHPLVLPVLFFFMLQSAYSQQTAFISCLQDKIGSLTNILHAPKNPSYTPTLQEYIKNSRFNKTTTPKPNYIVTPNTFAHVQAIVICANASNMQIKIRSGGHDYEGISYTSIEPNFILHDMFNLRNIFVNVGPRLAYVQAEAQMGELYYNIWKASNKLAIPGGVCPTLGVDGHISGGGYGTLLRKYGLSVDNVVDAEILDVHWRILDRERMVVVPEIVTVFRVERVLEENATDLVHRWQNIAPIIDDRLFVRLMIQPVTIKPYGQTIKASFIAMFLGNGQELLGVMNKEFPELGVNNNDVHEMRWTDSVLFFVNFDNKTKPEILLNRHSDTVDFGKRKSDYFQTPVPKTGSDLIFKKMMELGKVGFAWNPYGGVMAQIPSSATPFPHRAGFLGAFLNYRDIDLGVNHNGANSYDEGKVRGYRRGKGEHRDGPIWVLGGARAALDFRSRNAKKIQHYYRSFFEKNEAFSKNNRDKMTNSIPSQKANHVGSSQNKKSYASSLNGDRDSKVEKQVTAVK